MTPGAACVPEPNWPPSEHTLPPRCQARAVIALTGPGGRRGLVCIHMSQVSRAETSGRATSHALSLVTAPRKPLPACSWHRRPEARGSCTALAPAAPPVPAHPSPLQTSLSSTGRGSYLPVQVEGPWRSRRQWKPHQESPTLATHQSSVTAYNLIVQVSSMSAHSRGRTEMPGWRPPAHPPRTGALMPICPQEAAGRTERAQALESSRSEFESQLRHPGL